MPDLLIDSSSLQPRRPTTLPFLKLTLPTQGLRIYDLPISESTHKLLGRNEVIIKRRISRSRDVLGRVRRYVHAIRVSTRRWVIIP